MIDRLTALLKMQVPQRNRGLLFASGTTKPTGDGYQTGCLFQKTDGGNNTALYVNEGSVTVANFQAIEGAGADGHDPIVLASSTATGIDFTGTYSANALDFSDATIVPSGSNGPCLIRAGTYASPIDYGASDAQSGMIRLYSTCSGDISSYDRGIFVYTETTGAKGAFPIAGLAEANNTGTGPKKLQAGQFIAHLGAQSSGATLSTAVGDTTAGMYASWFKIAGAANSVCASGSKAACIWLDSSMGGTMSGEHYGIYATVGGISPDGFIGFNTSASGYTQFIYADATFNSGAGTCITTDAVPGTNDARIKVWYDGKQYYIALWR